MLLNAASNNSANLLLAALPAEEYARLRPLLEEVPLAYAQVIYEPYEIIRRVYFPASGIVSLLASVGEKSLLEVGLVGDEGIVGLPIFLGAKTAHTRAIVQGAGAALMMEAADFETECERGGALSKLLRRYAHSLLTQIAQAAACNNFHPAEARLARWLLASADRMHANEFQTTQEFLAQMLGVRREAVNKAVTVLQQSNLIAYRRGKVSILNRPQMEATACACYFTIREEYLNPFMDLVRG